MAALRGAIRILRRRPDRAGRVPLPFFGIGLLVDTRSLTGSYSAAGVVTGAYAISIAAGGPLLGRLADRRGHARCS